MLCLMALYLLLLLMVVFIVLNEWLASLCVYLFAFVLIYKFCLVALR